MQLYEPMFQAGAGFGPVGDAIRSMHILFLTPAYG